MEANVLHKTETKLRLAKLGFKTPKGEMFSCVNYFHMKSFLPFDCEMQRKNLLRERKI